MAAQKNSLFLGTLNIGSSTKKLFHSIRRRKKAVEILTLIQEGADINARDSRGCTPVLLASLYGLKTVVNMLIDSGAIIDSSECQFKRSLLHYASGHGWTEMVQSFVKRVPVLPSMVHGDCSVPCEERTLLDIHAKDMDGRTALHLASYRGHLEVVKYLLEQGSDLVARSKNGMTPLHEASRKGHLEVVKFLLEKGASLDARNDNCKTPLHKASFEGHLEVVKYLLDKGADINARDKNGDTALHKASFKGHVEVVKYLLDEGADTELSTYGKPLLTAAKHVSFDISVLLINSGANVDCCDGEKCTVLHYASQAGWIEMVQYLVKGVPVSPFTLHRESIVSCEESARLTIHARDMNGRTALHDASIAGEVEIVKFLVEEGADPNLRSKDGMTALHEASFIGNLEAVKCLVEGGADMNLEYWKGLTPLLDAAQYLHEDVVELLVNSGANLDVCDVNKLTALHCATVLDSDHMVQSLVRKMSYLDARDCLGKTALYYASKRGRLHNVEYLLKAGASLDIREENGSLPIHIDNVSYINVELFKLFIEAGAYLMPVDYYKIMNDFFLKDLLRDVEFCCRAILNKFNAHDLPALYKLPASASLPHIENMVIASSGKVAREVERTVKLDIQRNGHCNVLEVRPMALSLFSVRTVLDCYDKKRPLKRLASSDSQNEYQFLSKSIRLS